MSIQSLRDNPHTLKVILAFAAVYVIWGTTYLGIAIAVETIPPFLMAGGRFVTAGAIMFLFLRARGAAMPRRLHWRSALIIGAFLVVGGNGFVTWSEQQVPSSYAALVVATVPLWIAVFGWVAFWRERPSGRVVAGVALGFVGIIMLIGPQLLTASASGISLLSWIILLLSPVLWSLGSLYSRSAPLPDDALMSTSMEMLAGGVLLLLAGLLTGEAARFDPAAISTESLLATLYLIVFGSIVAFTAYIWLLKNVPASQASTYTYVNPVIAVTLGWLVLGEQITLLMGVAMVIIIAAVVLITARLPRRSRGETHAKFAK